jgi:hypothetical protein
LRALGSSRLKSAAVGSASYSIAAGKSKTLKLTPPKSIKRLSAKRRLLALTERRPEILDACLAIALAGCRAL